MWPWHSDDNHQKSPHRESPRFKPDLLLAPRDGTHHHHHPAVAMIPLARHSVLRTARTQFWPTRTLSQPASSALARLLSTLAVLEQRDGKLQNSSLSAIAASQKLGGSVTGFLAGSGVKGTSAAEAAKIKGIEKVVVVENDAYEKVCCLLHCINDTNGCHL